MLQWLFNDLLMMFHRFVSSIHCQRGRREEWFHLQRVCLYLCWLFFVTQPCTSAHTRTHTEKLKYPLFFSHNSLFCRSVCNSEGILHPSNSPPGSFILRLGPAHIPCQRLSILLNIKSSVSRLVLSSPSSAPCIFRSQRPRYKAD